MMESHHLRAALGRLVGTRVRRVIVGATPLLATLTAAALASDVTSYGELALPVQSTMSVLVPWIGVLLISERRRTQGGLALAIVAALLYAAAVGLVGALICSVAVAWSAPAEGAWANVGAAVVGGVLVQLLAQLVGTAAGQLVRPPILASIATIVVPLGLWFVLRGTPATEWLTPAATLPHLLPGQMSLLAWTKWLVVVLLWGVGLNLLGLLTRRGFRQHRCPRERGVRHG